MRKSERCAHKNSGGRTWGPNLGQDCRAGKPGPENLFLADLCANLFLPCQGGRGHSRTRTHHGWCVRRRGRGPGTRARRPIVPSSQKWVAEGGGVWVCVWGRRRALWRRAPRGCALMPRPCRLRRGPLRGIRWSRFRPRTRGRPWPGRVPRTGRALPPRRHPGRLPPRRVRPRSRSGGGSSAAKVRRGLVRREGGRAPG